MMKQTLFIVTLLFLFSTSCILFQPSENAIQTAIAKTQLASAVAQSTEEPSFPRNTESGDVSVDQLPTVTAEQVSDLNDPRILWSATSTYDFAVVEDKVILQSGEGVEARELRTGEVIWSESASGEILGGDNELVYVSPAPQRIDALDMQTGSLRWRFLANGVSTKLVAIPLTFPDIVLFGAEFMILVVDRASGDLLNIINLDTRVGTLQIKQIGDILVSDGLGGFVVNPRTGEFILERADISKACGEIIIVDNRSEDAAKAIDVRTGAVLWTNSNDRPGRGIYCGSNDAEREVLTEEYLAGRDIVPRLNPLIADGASDIAYYGFAFSELLAVDITSGNIKWRGLTSAPLCIKSVEDYCWLGVAGETVVYSHRGFGLSTGFDAASHDQVWENGDLVLTHLVGAFEDRIIATVQESLIVALSPEGEITWQQNVGDLRSLNMLFEWLILVEEDDDPLVFIDPHTGLREVELLLNGDLFGYAPFGPFIVAVSEDYFYVIDPGATN